MVTPLKVRLVVVDPDMSLPSVRFVPLHRHWNDNGRVPEAATAKPAELPFGANRFGGWAVMAGD
jgi:hypothetical protein